MEAAAGNSGFGIAAGWGRREQLRKGPALFGEDVLRKADVPLLVSPDLGLMSAALFRPEPMGLILARRPSRIAHQSTAHR